MYEAEDDYNNFFPSAIQRTYRLTYFQNKGTVSILYAIVKKMYTNYVKKLCREKV